MFAAYLFFYLIGFNPDLIILKLKGYFILHGLRAIFRLFGLFGDSLVLVSLLVKGPVQTVARLFRQSYRSAVVLAVMASCLLPLGRLFTNRIGKKHRIECCY